MARHAALTVTAIFPLFRPRAFPRERGTNENNNGLMGILPERKKKFPATLEYP